MVCNNRTISFLEYYYNQWLRQTRSCVKHFYISDLINLARLPNVKCYRFRKLTLAVELSINSTDLCIFLAGDFISVIPLLYSYVLPFRHKAIADYLHQCGFGDTLNAFKKDANMVGLKICFNFNFWVPMRNLLANGILFIAMMEYSMLYEIFPRLAKPWLQSISVSTQTASAHYSELFDSFKELLMACGYVYQWLFFLSLLWNQNKWYYSDFSIFAKCMCDCSSNYFMNVWSETSIIFAGNVFLFT